MVKSSPKLTSNDLDIGLIYPEEGFGQKRTSKTYTKWHKDNFRAASDYPMIASDFFLHSWRNCNGGTDAILSSRVSRLFRIGRHFNDLVNRLESRIPLNSFNKGQTM